MRRHGSKGLARRLVTFRGWPHNLTNPNPLHIAKAGFVWIQNPDAPWTEPQASGVCDRVQCAECFCTYEGWQEGDDPAAIHAAINANCPFVSRADIDGGGKVEMTVPGDVSEDAEVPGYHDVVRDSPHDDMSNSPAPFSVHDHISSSPTPLADCTDQALETTSQPRDLGSGACGPPERPGLLEETGGANAQRPAEEADQAESLRHGQGSGECGLRERVWRGACDIEADTDTPITTLSRRSPGAHLSENQTFSVTGGTVELGLRLEAVGAVHAEADGDTATDTLASSQRESSQRESMQSECMLHVLVERGDNLLPPNLPQAAAGRSSPSPRSHQIGAAILGGTAAMAPPRQACRQAEAAPESRRQGQPSLICVLRLKVPGAAPHEMMQAACHTVVTPATTSTSDPRFAFRCGFVTRRPRVAVLDVSVWRSDMLHLTARRNTR